MKSSQDNLSANKRALLKIRELKRQLEKKQVDNEPIAVVSMACRFPKNADTPERFWQQLVTQESFVSDVPESRWDLEAFFDENPDAPGKMYTQKGVYLESIDEMDPEFFGISPREAVWVDPQQRLLLEVAWEAIERAGWLPEKIGDSTGVFVGWMHNDYQNEASDSFLNLNPYIATGAAGSFLCGRLAYYLGLSGPALAVDTACSSSLVALHLAIQSLQKRECDQALVGGVNVICSPTTNILTCKLKALSPSGHSRAFDASADGYLRGEGCGVVTLKRLSDATTSGDNILGVIKGSAIGHNGFSGGLTAPNPKAQEQVIRQAIQRANLTANDIDYLEAHGTGTELGDPLEVQAAISAYCSSRSENSPLLIGSVKTNIGHLEAAAGMAGLIKVLMSLQTSQIPGQINFENPNPHIPWDRAPIKVLTEPTPWPDPSKKIAGVSAFGMSGTNAHVIVESYPAEPSENTASESKVGTGEWPNLITMSGHSEDALYSNVEACLSIFAQVDPNELSGLSIASNLSRKHHDFRAAVIATNKDEAVDSLRRLTRSQATDEAMVGARNKKLKVAWQFTGQGSQYLQMAQRLYEFEPVFRKCIEECDSQLKEVRNESLKDVLFDHPNLIHDTYWTQPSIFAVQMGLSHLLSHWGVEPDYVLGHSVGQYAAACYSGAMSWQDGLRLMAERGRLISSLPREGKMAAIFANEEAVLQLLEGIDGVEIGAFNVSHIVVGGRTEGVEEVTNRCENRNVKAKILNTSHAFHSHLMEPILDEFAKFADEIEFQPCNIPLICNQSGKVLPADFIFDGKYWADHIRSSVQFQQSLTTALDEGSNLLLELGPKPVLTGMARHMAKPDKHQLLHCLDEKSDDVHSMTKVLGSLYVQGIDLDFQKIYPANKSLASKLPTYQFQRRRFWGPDKPRADHAEHHTAHPLLGSELSLANDEATRRFASFVDRDSPTYLTDHEVMDSVVMPGSGFVEMAIAAAAKSRETFELCDAKFERPLNLEGRTEIQTVLHKSKPENDQGTHSQLESYSKLPNAESWTRHFSVAQIRDIESPASQVDLSSLQAQLDQVVDIEDLYEFLASIDLAYGQKFQTIRSINHNEEELLVQLSDEIESHGYFVSPTILDGAFHSLAVGLSRDGDEMFLPVGLKKIRFFGPVQNQVWSHATWVNREGPTRTANLVLFSSEGEVLLEIEELTVQRMDRSLLRRQKQTGRDPLIHTMEWKRARLPGASLKTKKWLIVGGTPEAFEIQSRIKEKLEGRQHQCQLVTVQCDTVQCDTVQCDTVHSDSQADELPSGVVSLNLAEPNAWRSAEVEIRDFANPEDIDGVIWVMSESLDWNVETPSTRANCEGLISLIQRWRTTGRRQLSCGLQIVTENAIAIQPENRPNVSPNQTQYWGLGRVIAAECPEYKCRLIDVDSAENDLESLLDVILTESTEGQISIRDAEFHVPRIVHFKKAPTGSALEEFALREGVSYLVTGGLGKLGRQVALWMAQKGARQVILVSRRDPDDETLEFLEQIKALNCEPIVHQADLTSEMQVKDLFEKFGNEFQNLGGIIHSAGVLEDGLIENQTWEKFEKVTSPKIRTAWFLHQQSLKLDLEFFVLYSSVASTLGSPGQSNYATGNAFLDGLSEHRRHLGLPSRTINWGPWTVGMADDDRVKRRLEVQGIAPLEVEGAHAALKRSLEQHDQSHAIIIDVDWRKLKLGADGKTPKLLEELVSQKKKTKSGDSQLVAKLRSLSAPDRLSLVVSTVQGLFQEVLASDSPPETDRPLIEMGLDSLMAVEFGSSLQLAFGDQFELGPSLLFDHPTIDSIAEYLCSLIEAKDDGQESQAASSVSQMDAAKPKDSRPVKEDIAIIGLSCRFPGASDYEQYWQNLLNKIDSIGEIPSDRWDVEQFYSVEKEPGKMYTRNGGFLDNIDAFDADFFNVMENEACWIDPQHRLLLENCYHALEDAGIQTKPMAENNVGVFMGIMGQDYAFLPSLEDKEVIEHFEGAGLSHSAGVGRISYILGLEGPSVAIDTASSSSLVAVIQAARSLQEGNCNMALAGGVNAILAPVNFLLMSKAGLLSPDGRCKSFSADADGFGRGEGCGVVLLKRLSDAEKDGDEILAVIRGGAIGHNGFTGGLTTPSSKAQVRVIESAVADAGISANEVQYLEAHGTGTEFGDPIEMSAAVQVYGKGRTKDNPLIVGSAKANIGHLEAAGGVSGLIKTVLALHRKVIPPQNHFESPSRHIPWSRMPVEVPTEPRDFDGSTRFAAVTALGLAGTNAHLIVSNWQPTLESNSDPQSGSGDEIAIENSNGKKVEKFETQQGLSAKKRKWALFISANSNNSLTELLNSYQQMLTISTESFSEIAFQSGVSRRHFPIRKCIIASDSAEAVQKIKLLVLQKENHANGSPLNGSTGASPGKSDGIGWAFDHAPVLTGREFGLLKSLSGNVRKTFVEFDRILTENGQHPVEEFIEQTDNKDTMVSRFIVYACLANLFKDWGVEPDSVTGNVEGQFAAACTAGVMSWENAFSMLLHFQNNTSSKDSLEDFETFADQFNYYPPHISLVCSISGEEVPVHRSLGGSYWRQLMDSKFEPKAIETMAESDLALTIIMGSQKVDENGNGLDQLISGNVKYCESSSNGISDCLFEIVDFLYERGFDLSYESINETGRQTNTKLPLYPFDRKRYWITDVSDRPNEKIKSLNRN